MLFKIVSWTRDVALQERSTLQQACPNNGTHINRSVHTACKQHQRVCTQMCSRVLCERSLRLPLLEAKHVTYRWTNLVSSLEMWLLQRWMRRYEKYFFLGKHSITQLRILWRHNIRILCPNVWSKHCRINVTPCLMPDSGLANFMNLSQRARGPLGEGGPAWRRRQHAHDSVRSSRLRRARPKNSMHDWTEQLQLWIERTTRLMLKFVHTLYSPLSTSVVKIYLVFLEDLQHSPLKCHLRTFLTFSICLFDMNCIPSLNRPIWPSLVSVSWGRRLQRKKQQVNDFYLLLPATGFWIDIAAVHFTFNNSLNIPPFSVAIFRRNSCLRRDAAELVSHVSLLWKHSQKIEHNLWHSQHNRSWLLASQKTRPIYVSSNLDSVARSNKHRGYQDSARRIQQKFSRKKSVTQLNIFCTYFRQFLLLRFLFQFLLLH